MIEQILLAIASLGSFATVAIPFVTEFFFEKVYQPTSKAMRSLLVFVISIAMSYGVWGLGLLFDVGFLVEVVKAWHVLVYGVGAAFAASYTWVNIDWIKAVIRWIIAGDTSGFDTIIPEEPEVPVEAKKKKK